MRFIRTRIAVEGQGPFPLDMLRVDQCVPARRSDAEAIRHADGSTTRVIRLYRYSATGARASSERWRANGWRVVADSGK